MVRYLIFDTLFASQPVWLAVLLIGCAPTGIEPLIPNFTDNHVYQCSAVVQFPELLTLLTGLPCTIALKYFHTKAPPPRQFNTVSFISLVVVKVRGGRRPIIQS